MSEDSKFAVKLISWLYLFVAFWLGFLFGVVDLNFSFYQVLGIAILWPLFAVKYLAFGIWLIINQFTEILIEGGKILLGTW